VQPADTQDRQALATALAGSGLFNANWPLQYNGDVAAAGIDPFGHYIRYGGTELRWPNHYSIPPGIG
jgi:hypothetical protein